MLQKTRHIIYIYIYRDETNPSASRHKSLRLVDIKVNPSAAPPLPLRLACHHKSGWRRRQAFSDGGKFLNLSALLSVCAVIR